MLRNVIKAGLITVFSATERLERHSLQCVNICGFDLFSLSPSPPPRNLLRADKLCEVFVLANSPGSRLHDDLQNRIPPPPPLPFNFQITAVMFSPIFAWEAILRVANPEQPRTNVLFMRTNMTGYMVHLEPRLSEWKCRLLNSSQG